VTGKSNLNKAYSLPQKIPSYLRRIAAQCLRVEDSLKHTVVNSSRVHVVEETEYDGWNGGTAGHDVQLYVQEDVFNLIPLIKEQELTEGILADLRLCAAGFSNEFISVVRIYLADENDSDFQRSMPISERPQINPDSLSIWKSGFVRLFISHRDAHKKKAFELSEALETLGISTFVAHDTIEATKEWRREILNGLETMEVMLVFLTDDFHESIFTNQEIGYALGRRIPIVSLKLEGSDPSGFISHEQALRGSLDDPAASAIKIQKLVAERLGRQDRIQQGLISAFLISPDFDETKLRFDRLVAVINELSEAELAQIIEGFSKNGQLYQAGHLVSKYNRLKNFLEKTTIKKFQIEGREIREINKRKSLDETPF
jgi:TIR domain